MNQEQAKMRITVLGSTGSIGTNTLDVIARHPQRFEVYALSASRQVDLMLAQCLQFKPRFAVMVQLEQARALAEKLKALYLIYRIKKALLISFLRLSAKTKELMH